MVSGYMTASIFRFGKRVNGKVRVRVKIGYFLLS